MSSKIDCSYQDRAEERGHFKILIPSYAVGAIIGPKGKTISRLQDTTRAKIEISRVNDYYPGTTERVCLISGGLEAIFNVHKFIMEAISEKPYKDLRPCIDFGRKRVFGRKQQVKILVPNKIVSKIIGSGGLTIKDIQERSGAFVQVSQMSPDVTLFERCVTVMGEIQNIHFACRLILQKVVGDQVMDRFLHVSYSNAIHNVPNSNPTGSPIAQYREVRKNTRSSEVPAIVPDKRSPSFPNMPYSSLPVNTVSVSSIDINQLMETLKFILGNAISEEGFDDIRKAMFTLANYGVLEHCLRILMNERLTGSPVLNDFLMEKSTLDAGTNFSSPRSFNDQSIYFQDTDTWPMNSNFITRSEQVRDTFGPIGHFSDTNI